MYPERTKFFFYALPYLPFLVTTRAMRPAHQIPGLPWLKICCEHLAASQPDWPWPDRGGAPRLAHGEPAEPDRGRVAAVADVPGAHQVLLLRLPWLKICCEHLAASQPDWPWPRDS
jgi:hypothetical protein